MLDPSSSAPHPELQRLRLQLKEVLKGISSFGPTYPKPPILESSADLAGEPSTEEQQPAQDHVPGLRALRDAIKRDLDVLEKFLAQPNCASLPALSTNAPYLISVWHEVLLAPQPVVAIWSTFSESGKAVRPRRRGVPKEAGVKVDVVAAGGKQWIRVNTTKNSRMLAEFREIDSYLTDSEDDSDDEEQGRPTLAATEFDNSVLRMGRSLLTAAKENPIPGTSETPVVTLRLTRLDPSPPNQKDHDLRIAQTIEELSKMRIDVQLGEREASTLPMFIDRPPIQLQRLEPTARINLDLSILIALVSDLTHSPLPQSAQEAEERFTPSLQYREWKKNRLITHGLKATPRTSGDTTPNDADMVDMGKHSRALTNQALQEMGRGLIQELHDRLSALPSASSASANSAFPHVEFWTTPEARARCLKIVSKIGGPNEKRRTHALFPPNSTSLIEAEDSYWLHSRYPRGYVPLLPIRILPSFEPDHTQEPPLYTLDNRPFSPFFQTLAKTCRAILSQETMPDPRSQLAAGDDYAEDEENDGEIQRATVTKANPRLTAHTVQSLLWGAVQGWTTLTANKTSIKAILREIKASRNDACGETCSQSAGRTSSSQADVAAIWTMDPRSLAEGMRADYGST